MNITFDELRQIKHSLPTGSIRRIAQRLELSEQTVRNYFGASDYCSGDLVPKHMQQGPSGGVLRLEDTRILEQAREILQDQSAPSQA